MRSENEIIALKEKYYKRNYVTMLLEAFCVNFAFSIFSYTTVFPVYVQNITSNSFFVALVAVVYFGCSYGSSILSCLVGLNAKSPKVDDDSDLRAGAGGFFVYYPVHLCDRKQ